MTHRLWRRAALVVLSAGLAGVLAAPSVASAQPSTPSTEIPGAVALPMPNLVMPQIPAFPQLPAWPGGSSQVAESSTPATEMPAAETPVVAGSNLGDPALAMLGVAGQGVRLPLPKLM